MTQYLILHKVRGEPSFDCAEEIEPGMWITNSGYRAYPFLKWEFDSLIGLMSPVENSPGWANWPDHFQVQGEKPPSNFNIMEAISGLLPKIRRRV